MSYMCFVCCCFLSHFLSRVVRLLESFHLSLLFLSVFAFMLKNFCLSLFFLLVNIMCVFQCANNEHVVRIYSLSVVLFELSFCTVTCSLCLIVCVFRSCFMFFGLSLIMYVFVVCCLLCFRYIVRCCVSVEKRLSVVVLPFC